MNLLKIKQNRLTRVNKILYSDVYICIQQDGIKYIIAKNHQFIVDEYRCSLFLNMEEDNEVLIYLYKSTISISRSELSHSMSELDLKLTHFSLADQLPSFPYTNNEIHQLTFAEFVNNF